MAWRGYQIYALKPHLFGLKTFKKAKGKIYGINQKDGDGVQIKDE